jgi:hypothetical protein
MVHAENIDSGISNFQLDNCSGRDHHSLAHHSKLTLKHASVSSTDQGGGKRRAVISYQVKQLRGNLFVEVGTKVPEEPHAMLTRSRISSCVHACATQHWTRHSRHAGNGNVQGIRQGEPLPR